MNGVVGIKYIRAVDGVIKHKILRDLVILNKGY